MTFHTTGIVLKIINRGESDRVAHIYTDTHGKLELFVKSARRSQSKLSPHLEEFTLASCYVVRGRLDHLAGIERIERFSRLRASLGLLGQAAWAAEVVDQLTKPDHPDSRIFDLLLAWCTTIEASASELPPRLELGFLLHLLKYLGYRQEFDFCAHCKASDTTEWFLRSQAGGLVCAECRARVHGGLIRISPRAREALRLENAEPSARFHPELLRELDAKLADAYRDGLVAIHLDRPLATRRFLESLARA